MFNKKAIKGAESKYVCCNNCGVRIQKEKANVVWEDKTKFIYDNDPAFKTIKENFPIQYYDYDCDCDWGYWGPASTIYRYVAKSKFYYCLYCFENKIKKNKTKKGRKK